MEASDEVDARAFWDDVQATTGARTASWDTFSAMFVTFMRRRHTGLVSQLPQCTPAEMVLRYAFDRGSPARAAASEVVTARHLDLFLRRFGPMSLCLVKAASSLFDENGCLRPWFHGNMSRDEASKAIDDWEANNVNGRPQSGVFLFRYSDRPEQPSISFAYRRKERIMRCLINNNGPQGYELPGCPTTWRDLGEFVSDQLENGSFRHAVPSALHSECRGEIQERNPMHEYACTPEGEIADIRTRFADAQARVIGDIGTGPAANRVLQRTLGIVQELELRLGESELGDAPLMAKVLRLAGDILWKLRREREGVRNYLRCLQVVAEAEENQDAAHDGIPVVTVSVLSHVHHLLARYFLRQRSTSNALHHFSELVACTTDLEARRQIVEEFRSYEGFNLATAGLTHDSVEAKLDEAIYYFRRQEYEPAGEIFHRVLRDARSIGEGKTEARALGNLATVDYKTHRFAAAIRKYRTCVQLLRQQGNQSTERKILNYLVMCCIEAHRWAQARRFHEQLSNLAESDENIMLLTRLSARIQEGIDAQAQEEGADGGGRGRFGRGGGGGASGASGASGGGRGGVGGRDGGGVSGGGGSGGGGGRSHNRAEGGTNGAPMDYSPPPPPAYPHYSPYHR